MQDGKNADERKIEKERHYDCLETDVREEARKNFRRKPYEIKNVPQYVAKKYKIGGNADGRTETDERK